MMYSFSASSFIAGVMFGALLAGAWFFAGNPSSFMLMSSSSPGVSSNSSSASSEESGAVSVSSQQAGDTVTVESVTVPPPGVWVAVRETSGADLGNVLGAVRVNGPRSSVSVSLLRATVPSQAYAVELYRDDNGGAFDPAANSVYVDFATGAPVIARFTTTE